MPCVDVYDGGERVCNVVGIVVGCHVCCGVVADSLLYFATVGGLSFIILQNICAHIMIYVCYRRWR